MSDTDLAGQVAGLRREVEQLTSLIRTVAHGLGEDTDALGRGLLALTERLDDIDPAPPQPAPAAAGGSGDGQGSAPKPQAWVDYASATDWRELAQWVDWLHTTYDLRPNMGVPTCWPAHRGVTEELAALWAAWRQAATEARPSVVDADGVERLGPQADSSSLLYFHDRWLASLLARLAAVYRIGDCRQSHNNFRAAPTTNANLLIEASGEALKAP